jgi:hypothetical protein
MDDQEVLEKAASLILVDPRDAILTKAKPSKDGDAKSPV